MPLDEILTDATTNDIVVALPFVAAARAASAPALGRFGRLYGSSSVMQEVYRMIEKVSPTEATVFITGESGCGKELVARTIHERSARARGGFVAINCGAIPQNLIEAELFGHERGAFTGANRQHRGCFERAEGGTLFLDEITEMAPEMQVRLLRVLETGRFTRVGGDGELRTNVRVLAATNRDAIDAVRDGPSAVHQATEAVYDAIVLDVMLPGFDGFEVLRRLRAGFWSVQQEIDLHGARSEEARALLVDFLDQAQQRGHRCVRVIHGKGRRSPNGEPVLKRRVTGWLAQRGDVLAFCEARPEHGGSGAMVVLLRAGSRP